MFSAPGLISQDGLPPLDGNIQDASAEIAMQLNFKFNITEYFYLVISSMKYS
jgi:hypothetical protein